jgi:hypothetical protein
VDVAGCRCRSVSPAGQFRGLVQEGDWEGRGASYTVIKVSM